MEAAESQRETNAYRWLKQCQRLAAGWGSARWGAGTLQQGAVLIHRDERTHILHPIFLRWWPSLLSARLIFSSDREPRNENEQQKESR